MYPTAPCTNNLVVNWLETTHQVPFFKVRQGHHVCSHIAGHGIRVHGSMVWHSGGSVSLSSDGRLLAVGAGFDDYNIGATWIFVSDDGAMYQQLGMKLVGNDADRPWSFQGKTRLVMHAVL